MNVTFNKIDDVNAQVTVEVTPADYSQKVEQSMKDLRKKATIPGFRRGMTPMSLVQKMYGKSVLFEEINRTVIDGLFDYLKNEKINVLGEPLPAENQPQHEFDQATDFSFTFDLGLSPEIHVYIDKTDKIEYYHIKASDEMVNKQIDSYLTNLGEYEQADTVEEKDLVKGVLTELDADGQPATDGLVIDNAILMPSFMKNADEKAKIIGAKAPSEITFNPFNAYEGNAAELASLLKIKKEEIDAHKGDFRFNIAEITRYVEAKIDQKLFDKALGKDVVSTEADFRKKVAELIEAQMQPQSDFKFAFDVRDYLKKKVGDVALPEAFLKRFLLRNQQEPNPAKLDEDFPKIAADLVMRLINDRIIKDNDINVSDDDIIDVARAATRQQFANYGMSNLPDDMLQRYVDDMLKKEETVQNLAERAMENKLIATLKERMNVETKNVSVEEFTKMLTPPAEQTDEEKADEAAAESIAETAAETAPQAEVPEKKAKKTARKKSDEPEPGLF